jgi:hypothetical protein
LEIGVVLEVIGVYGVMLYGARREVVLFLFIGGQITPDVSVLNFY